MQRLVTSVGACGNRTFFSVLAAALCVCANGVAAQPNASDAPSASGDKKSDASGASKVRLIEFGWDEPDTAFLRAHLATMEQTPFDGCVFHANYLQNDQSKGSFTWQAWGDHAFSQSDLREAMADLQALKPARFRHNFLRFNTTPAKLDWFDDYGAVVQNAKLAGTLAKAGPCDGVLFDIEQYEGPLFDYRKQRDRASKSWDVYAAQARTRGREVMEAFQQGFPGLTLFLTFGYSLPWSEAKGDKTRLPECRYGLLAPFLDGMVDAAAPGTRLVDGYEISYGYKDVKRFAPAYETMAKGLLPIVADPAKYKQTFSFSFGLWIDEDWRKVGWSTQDFSKNFYSPESFERSLATALRTADDYVWIYTEKPRWWSEQGVPVELPEAYSKAVERARAESSAPR